MKDKIFVIIFVIIIVFLICNKNNVEQFQSNNKDWLYEIFPYRSIITVPNRINHVKKFCKSFHVKPTIFNAILKEELIYSNLYGLKIGEIACALSQEQVLRNFVESGKESIILFEDDNIPFSSNYYSKINLTLPYIKQYIKNAYNALPRDWDVLYLGRCWDNCNKNIKINKYLYKTYRTLCHHAIAFSRQGAITILEAIIHPIKSPIDHIVANLTMEGSLDSYATIVPLFYQSRDTIKSTIGNFDKLPVCA